MTFDLNKYSWVTFDDLRLESKVSTFISYLDHKLVRYICQESVLFLSHIFLPFDI